MFHSKTTSIFLILTVLCQLVFSAPGLRAKRADDSDSNAADLNPVELEESSNDGLDREKRKLPEAKFAAKNAILGFVFGASQKASGKKLGVTIPKTVEPVEPVVIPELDRNKVSLDIPDELFANSITTFQNVSKIFGTFVTNSARRYAQLMEVFQPLIGKDLKIRGARPPPSTTTESSIELAGQSLAAHKLGVELPKVVEPVEPVVVPEFDRNKVMLDISPQLFASSYTTIDETSKIVGVFIKNSARRFAQLVEVFQPLIGKELKIRGQYPPPPTTTETATTELV